LNACLDYWTAKFPDELSYSDAPTTRSLARKAFAASGPQMREPEDLNAYVDMMDVGRNFEGDPFNLFGTERDGNDNAGPTPGQPFPLEPPQ
jgi:hypothetical protein